MKPFSMRMIMLFILCLIIPLQAFPAEKARIKSQKENADILNKANKEYASKEYDKALKLYSELIERGIRNTILFYNLGNTYYKLGKIGYAILYYEKALSLKPLDRDVRRNIDYARGSLKERVRPLYSESLYRFTRTIYMFIKPGTVAYSELFFFTLLIGVLFMFIFLPHLRGRLKTHIITLAALLVLSAIVLISYVSYETKHPKAIVVEKEVGVLTAPIPESETLFILYEGTKAKILEMRGEWMRIVLADGRDGWVIAGPLALI